MNKFSLFIRKKKGKERAIAPTTPTVTRLPARFLRPVLLRRTGITRMRRRGRVRVVPKRRQRVAALDEPAQSVERGPGEDRRAPGVGVPPAVLPDREPPLLPQRDRVGVRRVRRVRVLDPVAGELPGVGLAARELRRGRRRGGGGGGAAVLAIGHGGGVIPSAD